MITVGRCGAIAQQVRDQAKAVIYFCHVDLTVTEWLCSFLTIPNLQRLPQRLYCCLYGFQLTFSNNQVTPHLSIRDKAGRVLSPGAPSEPGFNPLERINRDKKKNRSLLGKIVEIKSFRILRLWWVCA